MKNSWIVWGMVLAFSWTFGQEIEVPSRIDIVEKEMVLEDKTQTGWDVLLQGKERTINAAWAEYLIANYKFVLRTKGKSFSAEQLSHPNFSAKTFALFSLCESDASGTHLRVWMNLEGGGFVSSANFPAEAQQMRAAMKGFVKSYYEAFLQEELKKQNKIVEKQNKALGAVVADKAKLEKSLLKMEAKKEKIQAKKDKYLSKIAGLNEKVEGLDQELQEQATEIKQTKTEKSAKETLETENSGTLKKVVEKQTELQRKIEALRAL